MKALGALCLFLIVLVPVAALANVPGLMNYQGTLTDDNGMALDTTVAMTFSIYTDSTAGIQVWTETQPAVTVGSGLFHVLLGSVNAIQDTVFKDAARWLGVQVGGDPELSPRQRMASVAYAMRTGGDGDWTISGNNMYSVVSGYVGIGTSSPGEVLDVNGDMRVGGGSGDYDYAVEVIRMNARSGVWFMGVQNEATEEESDFYIGLDSVEDGIFHIERGGNVGIGTTDPGSRLEVITSSGTSVYGQNTSSGNRGTLGGSLTGVYGYSDGAQGVYGESNNLFGTYGLNTASANWGYLGGEDYGAYGMESTSGNYGFLGGDNYGVFGQGDSMGVCGWYEDIAFGYLGHLHYAVYGKYRMTGAYGALGAVDDGVVGYGRPDIGYGVYGMGAVGVYADQEDGFTGGSLATPTYGVYGRNHYYGNYGYFGSPEYGAYGKSDSSGNYGYLGGSDYGAYGSSSSGRGVYGWSSTGRGVFGYSSTGYGVYGQSLTNYAGYFSGDVHITGDLTGGKTLIDHPLDPENKLLRHNVVESPENLLIYRGKAKLDLNGEVVVELPDYFAALTREDEASIHLTPVGRPFLTGAEWNAGYRSLTVYGQAGREVFWEVLADRDDPVVRQLEKPVEEEKGPDNKLCDRGELLYPAAYGYPESMGKDYEDRVERERLEQEELERQEEIERQRKEEKELSRRVIESETER